MLKIRHPGRWKTSDGELVHRKMDSIFRGGQGAKRLWTESVRNAEHFETVPDLIKLICLVAMRAGATPVLIPNTTVKTCTADGTILETVWKSRRLPDLFIDRMSDERAGTRVPGP